MARPPRVSKAAFKSNALSTPPENATTTDRIAAIERTMLSHFCSVVESTFGMLTANVEFPQCTLANPFTAMLPATYQRYKVHS